MRSALATGVASAALLAYGVRPVRAAPPLNCTTDGTATIVTCTGDQSAGVLLSNGGGTYTILNVNNLTTNIAPASGVTGVEFDSNGAVTLNVNPGPFAIITTDTIGIFAVEQHQHGHHQLDRRHLDVRQWRDGHPGERSERAGGRSRRPATSRRRATTPSASWQGPSTAR